MLNKIHIVADENLAFTDYFFAEFGQITQRAGRTLTQQDLIHCQALLVRSVTHVNAQLLQHTPVQFVGSATIGTDHLDIAMLAQQHITWANAAGCNAQAVAEYVITALLTLRPELLEAGADFCLGIIGLGNVGTRLAALAKRLDWQVVGTDPFVQHEGIKQLDLNSVLQRADAVSLHVPFTKNSQHATHHLINTDTFALMQPHCILINSARGSVIEETALLADIKKTGRSVVLDVFEHEPKISKILLDHLALVTPHIAGYSLEGKARGTQMIYQAFCQYMGVVANKDFRSQLADCPRWFNTDLKTTLKERIHDLYNIRQDDTHVRACIQDGWVSPVDFDLLRKHYPLRREWSAYGDIS